MILTEQMLLGGDAEAQLGWLQPERTADLMREVLALPLKRERLFMYGREMDAPRATAWVGRGFTPQSRYTLPAAVVTPFSGLLATLRRALQRETGTPFNACLVNLYEGGRDSVSWHNDEEHWLVKDSQIASVTLGAPRTFQVRARGGGPTLVSLDLGDGDLLVMGKLFQARYEHAVPKTEKPVGVRVNLTFRHYCDEAPR